MLVLGALVPLAWALLALLTRPSVATWRDAALLAGVVLGLGVVAFTEVASTVRAVDRTTVTLAWLVACASLGAAVVHRRPALPALAWPESEEVARGVGVVAVLLGALLVLGILGAPSNNDSMTYHLTRVARWAQAGSIEHFPTWSARQLYSNPFAELLMLHGVLLTGGDRLANAVQCGALGLAALAVSALAQRGGVGVVGQTLAALFAVSLSGAVLQGQSTQNDLVVAALLVTAGVFGVDVARGRAGRVQLIGWAGALGLAALTKGTAFLLGPVVVLAPALALLRRRGRRALWPLLAAGLLALAPLLGHTSRNVRTFGAPLLPEFARSMFEVSAPLPLAVASNALRMGALHLGTPSPSVNVALERAVRWAHEAVGLDADDHRVTLGRFSVPTRPWHEDYAPSPWHLLLAVAACVAALAWPELRGVRPVALAVVVAALLTCALLKWQPFLCRLTLPVMIASGVLVGALVERLAPITREVLACAAVLHAVYALGVNESRRLLPHRYLPNDLSLARDEQYFASDRSSYESYREAADWLLRRDEQHLGIIGASGAWLRLSSDERRQGIAATHDYEYPLHVMLGGRYRIEHVCPWPELPPHLAGAPPPPSLVLCLDEAPGPYLLALGWRREWAVRTLSIWSPAPPR